MAGLLSKSSTAPPAPPAAGALDLDALLDRLDEEFTLGVRERIEALLLIARFSARGLPPQTGEDFANILSPLLATSPERQARVREVCEQVVAQVAAPRESAPIVTPVAPPSRRMRILSWLQKNPQVTYGMAALLVFLVGAAVLPWFTKPVDGGDKLVIEPLPPRSPPPPPLIHKQKDQTPPPAEVARALVERVARSGEDDGTATLRGLSRRLAPSAQMVPDRYMLLLVDYTGFAPDQLVPLSNVDVLARVTNAAARIEAGAASPLLADIQVAARERPAIATDAAVLLRELQAKVGTLDKDAKAEDVREGIKTLSRQCEEIGAGKPAAQREALSRACERAAEKAVALWYLEKDKPFAARWSWEPAAPTPDAPAWAPWAAAMVPVSLTIGWLGWRMSQQRRLWRADLRRQMPPAHPLHHPQVAAGVARLAPPDERLRQDAQALSRRSALPSKRIDVRRTIARMARSGSPFDLVLGVNRPHPEYLLLAETATGPDHQARSIERLVERLRGMDLSVECYRYVGSPRRCFRDWSEDARPLDVLAAEYPNHRLVIVGEGRGLLDPVDLQPEPWTQVLETWTRRALLSPVPVESWGAEEFALGRDLGLALGRATPDGLSELPALLGLDGRERLPLDIIHDQRARASLLGRRSGRIAALMNEPERWLEDTPPVDLHWAGLRLELHEALGRDGYLWLAVCALYPTIEWDLTLYLGQSVKNDSGRRLYDERTLAVLSSLPWFRAGRMPLWLRRRLQDEKELPVKQKAEALAALGTLLLKAPEPDKHTVARWEEAPPFAPAAGRPYRDDLFVDALIEGRGKAGEGMPKELDRLLRVVPIRWGLAETLAALCALAYAAVAWLVTPSAEHGALGPGAWLPLVALMLGGALALLLSWRALSSGALIEGLTRTWRRVEPAVSRSASTVRTVRERLRPTRESTQAVPPVQQTTTIIQPQPAPESVTMPESQTSPSLPPRIFLARAPQDREWASRLTSAFQANGWPVFDHSDFPTDQVPNEWLAKTLDAATVVIIVWSTYALSSGFIRTVANWAIERRMLITLRVDGNEPPKEHYEGLVQDMQEWRGDELPPALVEAIARRGDMRATVWRK